MTIKSWFTWLYRKPPDNLIPFSKYKNHDELAVDADGNLYWKNKKIRTSELDKTFIVNVGTFCAGLLTAGVLFFANADKIMNNDTDLDKEPLSDKEPSSIDN